MSEREAETSAEPPVLMPDPQPAPVADVDARAPTSEAMAATGPASVNDDHADAEPDAAGPAAADPAPAEAVQAEPLQAEPIQAEPIQAEPIQAEPIQAEPIQAEPIQAEPSQAEPLQAEPLQAEPDPDHNKGLGKIAQYHFAAAMAAFTLFGAGDIWAVQSGLWLAGAVSVANGLIAGVVLAYLSHEWGHFAGARYAGARSPVLPEPRSFFMFSFDMERNSVSQFLSMSRGGPLANWLFVVALWLLLPMNTAGQAMFFAAAAAIAVSVSVFEVPIINRTRAGGDPGKELTTQLERGVLRTGRNIGIAVGAVLFLILV